MMAPFLSSMNVGYMQLDERDSNTQQRVPYRDRRVCPTARVKHDAICSVGPCLLDTVDNSSLPVAAAAPWIRTKGFVGACVERLSLPLEKLHRGIKRFALLHALGFDIAESLMPVDVWLADSKEVQVGAVNYQDGLLAVAHLEQVLRFVARMKKLEKDRVVSYHVSYLCSNFTLLGRCLLFFHHSVAAECRQPWA